MRRTQAEAQQAKGRRSNRQRGYTLAEMLVVLVILALLTALIAPRVLGRVGQAKGQTAKVQAENLVQAVEMFRLDVGRYPAAAEGLAVLLTDPGNAPGWAGPYLSRKLLPPDPWGQPFTYTLREDGGFAISSLGADGKPGGDGENTDVEVGP